MFLLLLLVSWGACAGDPDTPEANPETYVAQATAILVEGRGSEAARTRALDVYDVAVSRFPDDARLLLSRAQLLAKQQRYEAAREDMDRAHTADSLPVEAKLFRCMLHERLAEARPEAVLPCYREVLHLYEQRLRETPAAPDANHVLSALLAESDDAEILLQRFTEEADPIQQDLFGEGFELRAFDRTEWINRLFPE